ncbi:DUF2971 domain-containing protein [Pseudoxanthomonas sp. LjRoot143]
MPRTHDRDSFFKLATRAVAKIMIKHRTIRWRTPLQFNDPFDTQTRLTANVDPDRFADRFVQRLGELAFSPEVPEFYDPYSTLHRLAMQTRANTPIERRDEFLAFLRPGAIQAAHTLSETLATMSDDIAAHMQHGRTFCLTEKINNVVMWSHYAEEHKGVGFKFRVLDDIDHPFRIAKPVTYSDDYVCIGDSVQMADHFTRAAPINLTELAWKLVYVKHSDWSYEKEWRCYWPLLNEPVGTGYIDPVQDPRLFEAIYLGCNMGENDADEIVQLARLHLPDTEIFKARKSRTSFDLVFDRIE